MREERLREDRNALLAGIRELHLSVIDYNLGLLGFLSRVFRAQAGLESADAAERLDATDEFVKPLHLPWAKMSSLQLLYANELGSEWRRVGDAQDRLLDATDAFLNSRITPQDLQVALNELSNQAMQFIQILTEKYLVIAGDSIAQSRLLGERDSQLSKT